MNNNGKTERNLQIAKIPTRTHAHPHTHRHTRVTAIMHQSSFISTILLSCCTLYCYGLSSHSIRNSDSNTPPSISNSETKKKLSVAVVGSGAVGCYYGSRLWETGQYDVSFHMRGDHYQVSKRDGLSVTSVHGDMFIPPESLHVHESTTDMGKVDWVVLALKSTSLNAAPSLVCPLLAPHTRVLAIMNGLIDEDLVNMLENYDAYSNDEDNDDDNNTDETKNGNVVPAAASQSSPLKCCAAIYGGMALVCSNRIAPGKVHHSYAGKLTGALSATSAANMSTPADDQQKDNADRQALIDLWRPTAIEFVYEEDIVRGRWSKNMWNLPFNGISVAMGGITVDKIVNDPGLRELAGIIMDETIAVGNAELESRGTDQSKFLGQTEKDQMMALSDNMGPYKPSTMLDFHARNPMEVKYLFRKAVDRANRINVKVPHLETLVAQIEAFQRFHGLF